MILDLKRLFINNETKFKRKALTLHNIVLQQSFNHIRFIMYTVSPPELG